MGAYVSPYASLRLFGGPRGTVRFVDGRYETSDPKEDAWLRAHRGFGVDFFAEGDARRPTEPKTPDPEVLVAQLRQAELRIAELEARLAQYERADDGEPVDPGADQPASEVHEESRPHRRGGRRG